MLGFDLLQLVRGAYVDLTSFCSAKVSVSHGRGAAVSFQCRLVKDIAVTVDLKASLMLNRGMKEG